MRELLQAQKQKRAQILNKYSKMSRKELIEAFQIASTEGHVENIEKIRNALRKIQ
jgi:hypothetical protein